MFSETIELGKKGERVVMSGLETIYKTVKDVPDDIETQLEWGDIVIPGNCLGNGNIKVEVKTEHKHTGNLFFETVSNAKTNRPGWAYTSQCDELYYLFWDCATGYRLTNFQTIKWHFDYHHKGFREVEQTKHEQHNLTIGRIVPISWVPEIYITEFDFSKAKEVIDET